MPTGDKSVQDLTADDIIELIQQEQAMHNFQALADVRLVFYYPNLDLLVSTVN